MPTHVVTYAHCVKATPGKLDREPWYKYERREVTLKLSAVYPLEPETEWVCRAVGFPMLSVVEDTENDAVQVMLYKLMVLSREQAEKAAV